MVHSLHQLVFNTICLCFGLVRLNKNIKSGFKNQNNEQKDAKMLHGAAEVDDNSL